MYKNDRQIVASIKSYKSIERHTCYSKLGSRVINNLVLIISYVPQTRIIIIDRANNFPILFPTNFILTR